jgi:hypothetical protein
MVFEDGPGRPGVIVHSGFAARLLTPVEIQRSRRTSGYYDSKFEYAATAAQTDDQGRFHLAGVLPDIAFDLKVQLLSPPDAKGRRTITGLVQVARPKLKPGEMLDLGDLRVTEPASP